MRTGQMRAASEEAARLSLREAGLFVLDLRMMARGLGVLGREVTLGAPVGAHDLAVYARQLATLLRAGVPVLDALSILTRDTSSRALRQGIGRLIEAVRAGSSLSQAHEEESRLFPPMLAAMIRAGEISGRLDTVFELLAVYYERRLFTEQKIRTALMYPVMLSVASIAVALFIMLKIVPTFVATFAQYGERLPWPTQVVMDASRFLGQDGLLLLGGVAALAVAHAVLTRWSRRYRLWTGALWFRVPVFGALAYRTVLAQASRLGSLLLGSGVPVLDGITATADTVRSEPVRQALMASRAALEGGRRWSEALSAEPWIPPFFVQMVRIGEQSGDLSAALAKVADFYEGEVQTLAERLESLLEPVLVLVLAAVVGILVLAVLMPTFQLVRTIH